MTPSQVDTPCGRATDRGNAASTAEVRALFDRIARVYDPASAPAWRSRIGSAPRSRCRCCGVPTPPSTRRNEKAATEWWLTAALHRPRSRSLPSASLAGRFWLAHGARPVIDRGVRG